MQSQKVTGTYSLPYIIKAEWHSYLIFSAIFGPMAVLAIYCTVINPQNWLLLMISICVLVWFLLWLNALNVNISEDRITYKTLFSQRREIAFSNIVKVEINVGIEASDNQRSGYYRYIIHEKAKQSDNLMCINMKPFSKRDLAILTDSILTKAPNVEFEQKVLELRNGNYKPIITEGLRNIWQILLWVSMMGLILALLKVVFR